MQILNLEEVVVSLGCNSWSDGLMNYRKQVWTPVDLLLKWWTAALK